MVGAKHPRDQSLLVGGSAACHPSRVLACGREGKGEGACQPKIPRRFSLDATQAALSERMHTLSHTHTHIHTHTHARADLPSPPLPPPPPQGTLAGSTVLLLSLAWGCSVILGRCDLSDTTGRAMDKRLTRGVGECGGAGGGSPTYGGQGQGQQHDSMSSRRQRCARLCFCHILFIQSPHPLAAVGFDLNRTGVSTDDGECQGGGAGVLSFGADSSRANIASTHSLVVSSTAIQCWHHAHSAPSQLNPNPDPPSAASQTAPRYQMCARVRW
jgi:hypothetical protein